jgi:two-component system, sensor histidine kinase and response regulator
MNTPISAERFDISDMRRRLGANDALIADLLRMFLDSYRAQVSAIKTAVETHELDAIRRGAHTFKGTAANLSFPRVMEASALLEEAAERGETAELDGLFARLVREVDDLVAEIGDEPARRL